MALANWLIPRTNLCRAGRGSYQRTRLTAHGFPRGYLMRQKQVRGFQTGDLVAATVPTGKKAGQHVGRGAVRKTGRFNIQTVTGVVEGIGYKHCRVLQRNDGYGYFLTNSSDADASRRLPPPAKAQGCPAAERTS